MSEESVISSGEDERIRHLRGIILADFYGREMDKIDFPISEIGKSSSKLNDEQIKIPTSASNDAHKLNLSEIYKIDENLTILKNPGSANQNDKEKRKSKLSFPENLDDLVDYNYYHEKPGSVETTDVFPTPLRKNESKISFKYSPDERSYADSSLSSPNSDRNSLIKEVEDKIFNMFLPEIQENIMEKKASTVGTGNINSRDSENNDVQGCNESIEIANFIASLQETGLSLDDPRLTEMNNIISFHTRKHLALNKLPVKVNRQEFHEIVSGNIDLIYRALTKSLIIPEFKKFCHEIKKMFLEIKANNHDGKVASYIPQLARANPENFAISICTIDGQRYDLGDFNIPFSLQSCMKPVVYAKALTEYGEKYVHTYVGREPSGRNFNEISLDNEERPHNPMINSGAIMTVSLLHPELPIGDRFDWIVESSFEEACGGEFLSFDNSVFLSERESADRNQCLAYFMKENGCYPEKSKHNFQESLELYFQLCSINQTSKSASVTAATLANGGVCPTTGRRVFEAPMVKHVLSLMLSCGMYDYSGQFAFCVGLPAKSGVSGSLVIVIPNLCGICVYSPKLDHTGNSCRGVDFAKKLVDKYNFHNFDHLLHRSDEYANDEQYLDSESDDFEFNINSGDGENNYQRNSMDTDVFPTSLLQPKTGQIQGNTIDHDFIPEALGGIGNPNPTKSPRISTEKRPSLKRTTKTKKKIDPRRSTHQSMARAKLVNLLFAAQAGDIATLMRFYLGDYNMNSSDYDNRTALHIAASEGRYDCVEYLVKYVGCDPFLQDRWGKTAMEEADYFGHKEIVSLLRKYMTIYEKDKPDDEEKDRQIKLT